MRKQGVRQRRKGGGDDKAEAEDVGGGGGGGDGDGKERGDGKSDGGLIRGKDGKLYKKRRDLPDVWTLLQHGAPPEEGGDAEARRPKRWYDDLVWPGLLFLAFCLSLFVFHVATHDKSVGRQRNRFTMQNVATGGGGPGWEADEQRRRQHDEE